MTNVHPIKPEVPLTPDQQEVVQELDELKVKTEKLAVYIAGNRSTMKKHVLHPLMSQLNAMCTYADVLQLRITLFNQVISDEDSESFDYPITSVTEMGNMFAAWHDKVVHDIEHLQSIPDGLQISVTTVDALKENGIPATPDLTLTGDALKGFKAGALWAQGIVSDLPFQKTEVPVDGSQGLPEAANEPSPVPTPTQVH